MTEPAPETIADECQGPGPHADPPLVVDTTIELEDGTTTTVRLCASPYCQPNPDPARLAAFDNRRLIIDQARAAYADNRALVTDAQVDAYLAAASPPAADTVKAVKLCLRELRDAARQRNGIIRLLLEDFDGTD